MQTTDDRRYENYELMSFLKIKKKQKFLSVSPSPSLSTVLQYDTKSYIIIQL